MRQEFKIRLASWQKDLHPGESKRVMLLESPRHDGEFMVRLEKTVLASLGGSSSRVVVTKNYVTTAQSNSIMDPAGDLSQLNYIIESLEKECNAKYDAAINAAIKNIAIPQPGLN